MCSYILRNDRPFLSLLGSRGARAPGFSSGFACHGFGFRRIGAGQQFLRRHLALFRLGQFDNEVDDLFLEDRRTQVVYRIGIAAIVVDDLTLVTGVAPRFLGQRLIEFLLGHRNIVVATDFGKQQAEADPPLGNALVFLLGLVVVVFVRGGGRFGVRGAFER